MDLVLVFCLGVAYAVVIGCIALFIKLLIKDGDGL